MDVAILILEIIIIIFLIYTMRTQRQALRSKESIVQDYKDIPELAKAKISMKEELYKMELAKKIKQSEKEAKNKEEIYLDESYELYKTIVKLMLIYADFWYFGHTIENMEDIITKKALLKELHERKKWLIGLEKKNPGSKLSRDVVLMRVYQENKLPN